MRWSKQLIFFNELKGLWNFYGKLVAWYKLKKLENFSKHKELMTFNQKESDKKKQWEAAKLAFIHNEYLHQKIILNQFQKKRKKLIRYNKCKKKRNVPLLYSFCQKPLPNHHNEAFKEKVHPTFHYKKQF